MIIHEKTVTDLFKQIKENSNNNIVFILEENKEVSISYKDLYKKSLYALSRLRKEGLGYKNYVIFQIEDIQLFITNFWACILGGIIPIPITKATNIEQYNKLLKIRLKFEKCHIITDDENFPQKLSSFMTKFNLYSSIESILPYVIIINEYNQLQNEEDEIRWAKPDDVLFLQFSSGSTGDPKGVIMTHKNIISNANAIIKGARISPKKDSVLSWLPLTHDMGLIGGHISQLASGCNHYIMTTSLYMRNPLLWLKKISEHKITLTVSPNFGFAYYLNFFKSNNKQKLDLSSLRCIFNGAEPIDYILCEKFLNTLQPYKLRKNVILPVYGLAEASLAASFPKCGSKIQVIYVNRFIIGKIGSKVLHYSKGKGLIPLLSVGKSVRQCRIRIVDENDVQLKDGYVGSIQLIGENITKGYISDPIANKQLFTTDGWLRTGDLGFKYKNDLYVCGRDKEIAIVNGQNIYLYDIERVASESQEHLMNNIVACNAYNYEKNSEEIIIFIRYKKSLSEFLDISLSLKDKLRTSMGINISHIIPIRAIPKTTSGKIQRFKLAEQYRNNEFAGLISEINKLSSHSSSKLMGRTNEDYTTTERMLGNILTSTMNLKEINIYENIFTIGADSLTAMMIISQVTKKLGCNLCIAELLSYSNIYEMALYIDKKIVSSN